MPAKVQESYRKQTDWTRKEVPKLHDNEKKLQGKIQYNI